ncbi:hypothetical protein MIMGU_mgv1a005816mg [Erythranthe guttata]|uniref:Ternary complex factor MIP1 leucine-zipper domain-containing protein n=1 Tax=Erythranthe guttata TaxID=4155 RepID=A0A022Q3A5_ERYGU|nr:hypothetical protein MIMGU_mgv1a005816mg [Erythranthe guttata]
MQSSWIMDAHKPSASRRNRSSIRDRKMALQQDVDKLKKRLRHEENVHRALERAFTRPPGTLPRLPPYLPAHTLELVAEVAVLEEEVVRLEEKVVHFRQGLYQEAVYISSSKKNIDNSADFYEMREKENRSSTDSSKNKQLSPNLKAQPVEIPVKKHPIKRRSVVLQLEKRVTEDCSSEGKNIPDQEEISLIDENPNRISESILKCLMNMFSRMSSKNNRIISFDSDPYNLCSMFGTRDIGPYKHLSSIGSDSIDRDRTTISIFLVQRLKILFRRLARISFKGLSHHEKLAFWINIYNSCMMNAFIEYGVPKCPERVVELMQMATVNVGGHVLNVITIEHFILRLPYHSKYTFSKATEYHEMMTRGILGLELSEPLVTFALSCGSWSSPATSIHLDMFHIKAIGISNSQRSIAIPKLLDWYMLDFAKDFDSLMDWICHQLPTELGKEAMKCVQSFRIMPYEFRFRYLLHT